MEYLLFLLVEDSLVFEVLNLQLSNPFVQLPNTEYLVPDVSEKGVEVLLHISVLVLHYVPPLHHHIIQSYVCVVEYWLPAAGHSIVEIFQQYVEICELVAYSVQGVRLVDEGVLEYLGVSCNTFVE